jgi:hypothetical protein
MGEMEQQTESKPEPSVDGPSTARRTDTSQINYPAVAVMIGGFLAVAGVFLKWFEYTTPVSGGFQTVSVNGTQDFTGVAVAVLGVLALACGGLMMMNDENMRRSGRSVGVVSAVLVLVFALYGLTRAEDAVGGLLGASGTSGLAIGIYASTLGGIIATVGAALSLRGRSLSS